MIAWKEDRGRDYPGAREDSWGDGASHCLDSIDLFMGLHVSKLIKLCILNLCRFFCVRQGSVSSGALSATRPRGRQGRGPSLPAAGAAVCNVHIRYGTGGDYSIPREAGSLFSTHKPLPSHQGPFSLINCPFSSLNGYPGTWKRQWASQKRARCSVPARLEAVLVPSCLCLSTCANTLLMVMAMKVIRCFQYVLLSSKD